MSAVRAQDAPVETLPVEQGRVEFLPLSRIQESTTNPRRTVKDAHFADLVLSVKTHGVLQPILVRPITFTTAGSRGRTLHDMAYELVAGHRRLAAAREALLPNVPAFIRELSDQAALEIQVIENLQRSDLHALEEAQGYQRLIEMKYDVARIAERIGRSAKYVYDRVKLLSLTKDVQKLFLADRITAGHAIILARLKPDDQARAIDVENANHYGQGSAPLFQQENSLFRPEQEGSDEDQEDPYAGLKVRSVRELQAWVDRHVRFDPAAEDVPDLFPETYEVVAEAAKIVNITHDHHVHPEAKDGSRIFGPTSWAPAVEKPCEYSVTGVIVIGPGRGEALKVCVNKEKCKVHWGAWQRERAKRRTGDATSGSTGEDRHAAAEARDKAERERRDLEAQRRKKAAGAVLNEIAKAIAKLPTSSTGVLGDLLVQGVVGYRGGQVTKELPRGKTAEDLVRHLAYALVSQDANPWSWESLVKRAKALGVNVAAIVDREVPPVKVQTPGKSVATAKKSKKK